MIRVDKFLANLGIGTRQEIALMCKKGFVARQDLTWNPSKSSWNQIIKEFIKRSDTKIPWWTQLIIDTNWECKTIEVLQDITLLIYKPVWYVCSDVEDGGHPSYRQLIKDCPYRNLVHVAGRLDWDTSGLVVATSDWDLNHRIISPKHKLIKTYIVTCEDPVSDTMIKQLEEGVELDDGYVTLPAQVMQSAKLKMQNCIELKITEGKYHQVKRMMEAVGNKVVALHRSSIGDWNLDGLKEGERVQITDNI